MTPTSNNLTAVFAALLAWVEALDDERRTYKQAEAATILGVTIRTLNRWRNEKLLGYIVMPGGDIRYRWSHIDEFLSTHEQPSKAEAARRRARSLAA